MPSEEYAREFADAKKYLPAEVKLPRSDYEFLSQRHQLPSGGADLMQKRVVLNLAKNYY